MLYRSKKAWIGGDGRLFLVFSGHLSTARQADALVVPRETAKVSLQIESAPLQVMNAAAEVEAAAGAGKPIDYVVRAPMRWLVGYSAGLSAKQLMRWRRSTVRAGSQILKIPRRVAFTARQNLGAARSMIAPNPFVRMTLQLGAAKL
jgi:hypothetical protein